MTMPSIAIIPKRLQQASAARYSTSHWNLLWLLTITLRSCLASATASTNQLAKQAAAVHSKHPNRLDILSKRLQLLYGMAPSQLPCICSCSRVLQLSTNATEAGAGVAAGFNCSLTPALLQGRLHLPDEQTLAAGVEGVEDLPVGKDHLADVVGEVLRLGVVDVLEEQVLGHRGVTQVPVVGVVHLPDVLVVLLPGCVPVVLHLLLPEQRGQDPCLVIVQEVANHDGAHGALLGQGIANELHGCGCGLKCARVRPPKPGRALTSQ